MARKLTFVPAATPSTFTMDLDSIPQDIRDEVEQAYKAIKENRGAIRAEFDSKEELAQFENMVKAYCNLRPAGAIRYRRSPVKGMPETEMQFRITDLETPEEKATREIRQATAKAAKAAKDAADVKPSPKPKK